MCVSVCLSVTAVWSESVRNKSQNKRYLWIQLELDVLSHLKDRIFLKMLGLAVMALFTYLSF